MEQKFKLSEEGMRKMTLVKPMFTGFWMSVASAIVIAFTVSEYATTGVLGWGLVNGVVAMMWMCWAFIMDRAFSLAINTVQIECTITKAINKSLVDYVGTIVDEEGLTTSTDEEGNDGSSNKLH